MPDWIPTGSRLNLWIGKNPLPHLFSPPQTHPCPYLFFRAPAVHQYPPSCTKTAKAVLSQTGVLQPLIYIHYVYIYIWIYNIIWNKYNWLIRSHSNPHKTIGLLVSLQEDPIIPGQSSHDILRKSSALRRAWSLVEMVGSSTPLVLGRCINLFPQHMGVIMCMYYIYLQVFTHTYIYICIWYHYIKLPNIIGDVASAVYP